MTYPGLVLLIGVGVGIGALLYYMFAENDHENEQEQQHNYGGSRGGSSDRRENWQRRSSRNEDVLLHMRNPRNPRKGEELRDCKEDINNCSICQYPLSGSVSQLQACRHKFHKDCIKTLRTINPRAPCPNCRRIINQTI